MYLLQFFNDPEEDPILALYAELAEMIVKAADTNPEQTVAIRKLLESRDAVKRAKIFMQDDFYK